MKTVKDKDHFYWKVEQKESARTPEQLGLMGGRKKEAFVHGRKEEQTVKLSFEVSFAWSDWAIFCLSFCVQFLIAHSRLSPYFFFDFRFLYSTYNIMKC